MTPDEIQQALRLANWDLGPHIWGRLKGAELSLCPAAFTLLARTGQGLRVRDGLVLPVTEQDLRVLCKLLDELAQWALRAGHLTTNDAPDLEHLPNEMIVDQFLELCHTIPGRIR